MEVPQKPKNRIIIWCSNLTPGCISGQNYNSKGYMHFYVHRSTSHKSQDMETTTCPSTDEWIKMWHIYIYIAFVYVDHNNYGKLLKRWEYQTILPGSWENCMCVKKQQLEPCMEQLIDSRLRKEYDRAVCWHPVCLTYKLSTSWEMPGWMSSKLELRYYSASKVCIVKAMVFLVVTNGLESWTIKKSEHQRIDAFELWCWRRSWKSLREQGNQTSQS